MRNFKVALAVACAAVVGGAYFARADIPASAYVQDGLIAQWDGIDNAGTGTHDAAATVWKDLKGTADVTLGNGDSVCDDAGVVIVENRTFAGVPSANEIMPMTLEIAAVETANIGVANQTARIFYLNRRLGLSFDHRYTGGTFNLATALNATPGYCYFDNVKNESTAKQAGNLHSYSGVLGMSKQMTAYYDGVATTFGSNLKWNEQVAGSPDGSGYLGTSVFKPRYYSIRLYNRALTADEVAYNAFVDRLRFGAAADDYRWNADKECFECRVSAQGTDGVTVSLDGATYSESVATDWTELGTPVTATVTAQAPQGCSVIWEGVPAGVAAVRSGNSITLTLSEAATLRATAHTCTTLYWRGTTDALASKPANWADAEGNVAASAPLNGDAIVLDANSANKPMTWDLDDVVPASWTQTADYTGTVTFKTGRSDDANTIGVVEGDERVFKVTGDVTINGGTVTHEVQPSMSASSAGWIDGKGVYRLIMDIGGDLTVAEGGSISAFGKGFAGNTKGPGNFGDRGAPGHGGTGNAEAKSGNTILKGCTYGCVKAPKTIGTAGANAENKAGGSIQLKVAGGTVLNGQLNANSSDVAWYGASGGSIYLKTKSLSGGANATISANASGSSWTAGGGRISLVLTGANQDFSTYLGNVSATPKLFQDKGSSAGTIYYETAADNGKGVLLVRGLGNQTYSRNFGTGLVQPGEDCDFSKIILTNGAHIAIGSNVTVRAKEILAYGGTAYHSVNLLGGKLVVPDDYVFTNITMYSYAPGSVLSPETEGGTLYLANGVTLSDDFLLTVPGDLHLLSGSAITHSGPFATDSGNRINLVCSNLTVDAGAQIHATGKGFKGLKGEGAPKDADKTARGGSHGGVAYDVGSVTTYGSITNPDTYGSGGASDAYAGGGVVRLTVRGTLTNNGTISSRSYATPWNKGGAGGSIYISTGRLVGGADAYIRADPSVMKHNYGAGGGRIAITLTTPGATFDEFLGKITAAGEKPDANPSYEGGAGTVYLRLPGEAENEGTLIVDNGGNVKGQGRTDISTSVTGVEVGRVVVTNGALLRVRQDATLRVKGDFVNASRFQSYQNGEDADADHAAGAIEFVDASRTSTLSGTNTFAAFVCTTPGKALRFPALTDGARTNDLLRIAPNGSFTIAGADGSPVTLASTVAGTPWLLQLMEGAAVSVGYAQVTDSDARAGGLVVADETTTIDRCENWKVNQSVKPGDPIAWTGAKSSVWADPENWQPMRGLYDTDVVTISADAANMPVLAASQQFNKLIVEGGATLTLAGYSIVVTNALQVAGTLVADGSETVTVGGDAAFATVTGAPALAFNGPGDVTFGPNGNRFASVVAGNAGDFMVTDGFASDVFALTRSAGATVSFSAGKTVSVRELTLLSDAVAAGLRLVSSTAGEQWRLDVSGKAKVYGVVVSDSRATGLTLHAEAPSVDAGNNANWVFNEKFNEWTGLGASADWKDAGNWSRGELPDVTTRVVLGAGAAVDVSEAVRIRELDVTGAATLSGTGSVTTVDAIDVQAGGKLTADVTLASESMCYVRNGGVLTHSANGTGGTDTGVGLDLTVAQDMTVEAGGKVTAEGKGFIVAKGPGGKFSGNYGGMHAGRVGNASQSVTYGSVLHPATLGSGGSGADSRNGGGRIRLSVGGTLRVEGSIDADGQTSGVMYYLGAGGSVWITCGTLVGTGAGSISANGGRGTEGSSGQSCGGRIAIYQAVATDFSGFAGTVRATAGWSTQVGNAPIQNSAGTIYLQSAGEADGCGTVTISQFGGDSLYDLYGHAAVELPVLPADGGDGKRAYEGTSFVVERGGSVRLLDDLIVKELVFTNSSSRLYLNGHTLRILSTKHRKGRGWSGVVDYGTGGQIKWGCGGLMLMVR